MNRGINRQEARLGMSMTDLQSVCVCSLFQPLGSRVGRAAVQQKRNTLHTLLNTHTHTNTQSNINEKILQSLNHYGNEKWKGSKNTILFLPLFCGNSRETTGWQWKGEEWEGKGVFFAFLCTSPCTATQISGLQHSALASKTNIGLSATGSNWVHVYVLGNQKKEGEREALVTCWLTAKSGKMVRKGEQPMHKQVQNQRWGKERGGKNRKGTGKGKGEQTWN